MQRTVLRFADLARDGMADGGRCVDLVMVTLTYRPGEEWKSGHISSYVQRASEWLKRRGYSYAYAWVAELQLKRMRSTGERAEQCLHYHVLWWLPRGVKLPKPDQCSQCGSSPMWSYGFARIERARSPGYIVKYASKGEDEPLPFGLRLFGVGAECREYRRFARWAALPAWIRERSSEGDVVSRLARAGWLNRSTGEVYESEWRFRFAQDEAGWVVWFERRGTQGETPSATAGGVTSSFGEASGTEAGSLSTLAGEEC